MKKINSLLLTEILLSFGISLSITAGILIPLMFIFLISFNSFVLWSLIILFSSFLVSLVALKKEEIYLKIVDKIEKM
jgi:hypothetical protein